MKSCRSEQAKEECTDSAFARRVEGRVSAGDGVGNVGSG